MIITKYRREKILKTCINILYNNPELFVISSALRDHAQNVITSDYDFELYVKYTLEKASGLNYIINQLCEQCEKYLILDNEINFDGIQKQISLATLINYFSIDTLQNERNITKVIHRLYNEEIKKQQKTD